MPHPDAHVQLLPETVVPGKPLGRHVHHDPRSLNYKVVSNGTRVSRSHRRYVGPFDQGQTGSCVGNATEGVLATAPFYGRLKPQRQAGLQFNEAGAVSIYSLATQLDPYPGQYPPTDTGSDGLSGAKAAMKMGYIKGYQHITSIDAAWTAIQTVPFIMGTVWLTDMDNPDSNGIVHASGTVRGGHEYEVFSYNATKGLWGMWQSWGPDFGIGGKFYMNDDSFQYLLSQQGDATVFVPN